MSLGTTIRSRLSLKISLTLAVLLFVLTTGADVTPPSLFSEGRADSTAIPNLLRHS